MYVFTVENQATRARLLAVSVAGISGMGVAVFMFAYMLHVCMYVYGIRYMWCRETSGHVSMQCE